jgi:hypothetical protein
MIPYLLAVVGGYFIGSSMKDETSSISMANGGYLKNYNVFGKVKVLVHDYADDNEYVGECSKALIQEFYACIFVFAFVKRMK